MILTDVMYLVNLSLIACFSFSSCLSKICQQKQMTNSQSLVDVGRLVDCNKKLR